MLYRTKNPVCRVCNLLWWFSITLHWALTNWSRWAYGHDCFLCQLLYRFLNPLKDCHNICNRLKHKLNAKKMVLSRKVIKNITKSAKYEAEKPIRRAKLQYQSKLKNQFSTFNTHVVWQLRPFYESPVQAEICTCKHWPHHPRSTESLIQQVQ